MKEKLGTKAQDAGKYYIYSINDQKLKEGRNEIRGVPPCDEPFWVHAVGGMHNDAQMCEHTNQRSQFDICHQLTRFLADLGILPDAWVSCDRKGRVNQPEAPLTKDNTLIIQTTCTRKRTVYVYDYSGSVGSFRAWTYVRYNHRVHKACEFLGGKKWKKILHLPPKNVHFLHNNPHNSHWNQLSDQTSRNWGYTNSLASILTCGEWLWGLLWRKCPFLRWQMRKNLYFYFPPRNSQAFVHPIL